MRRRRYLLSIAIATRTAVRPGLVIAGCMLIAANLRPPITSVGPLVGDIRADTGMSSAAAGLLTTLPLLAFAGVSPWAAPIARRIGIERALIAALAVLFAGVLVRSADVAESIIATANKQKCDLIMMASHGRRGLGRLLLGAGFSEVDGRRTGAPLDAVLAVKGRISS